MFTVWICTKNLSYVVEEEFWCWSEENELLMLMLMSNANANVANANVFRNG